MTKNGKAVLLATGLGITAGALGGWLLGIGVAVAFVAAGMEIKPDAGSDAITMDASGSIIVPAGWKVEQTRPEEVGAAFDPYLRRTAEGLRTESPVDDQTRVH